MHQQPAASPPLRASARATAQDDRLPLHSDVNRVHRIVQTARRLSHRLISCVLLVVFAVACSCDEPASVASNETSSLPRVSAEPAPSPAPAPSKNLSPNQEMAAAETLPYRGLWVLCEGSLRVLEEPARIRQLIEHAVALEVTDLFVQVYRGGRAWYRTKQADSQPFQVILERTGVDPLAEVIAQAHRSGLRVHAWVNVYSLNQNREAPILKDLGRTAVLVDRKGRSLLDYPPGGDLPETDRDWYRMGTPGIYLDPGAPGVAERLVASFEELITGYPELDGLHLDYIRYPGVLPFSPGSRFGVGLDFGYGPKTRLRFQRETGLMGPFVPASLSTSPSIVNANRWDAWRRDKVSELVGNIGEMSERVRPGLRLSAAVISYLDRAYLSLGQDWQKWLEDGLIDFVVPMVYSIDDRLFRYQVERFARARQSDRIWTGVGVWLFAESPDRALKQLAIAREAGVAGDALFSYDAIVNGATEPGEINSRLLQALLGRSAAP